jgi:methionyl-tRNA formyltransferase/acyl carrier protein
VILSNIGINKKECVVIGNTNLCIACLDELYLANWSIISIVTKDQNIKNWANKHNISCMDIEQYIANPLSTSYLFSIVNPWILSSQVLNKISNLAINYHDSPLPKYAGVRSTMWAILNDELAYGITWHKMVPKIDAGAIIRQKLFPIEEKETSYSLNVKCSAIALDEFKQLIKDIENDCLECKEQTEEEYCYFEANKFLPNLGFVNYNSSCKEVDRLKRALDFREQYSLSDAFKVCIKNKIYIIHKASIKEDACYSTPGKIIAITNDSLTISLKNGIFQIEQLLSPEGNLVNIPCLALAASDILIDLDFATLNQLLKQENVSRPILAIKNKNDFLSSRQKTKANDEIIEKVLEIWSRLLPKQAFDINDNFFDCGGNSILLAYLQWHIEKAFPIKLSVIDFFSHPTVMNMAQLIHQQLEGSGFDDAEKTSKI